MVAAVVDVFGEGLAEVVHHRVLLGLDEGLEGDTDGQVNVIGTHMVAQVHLGVGLGHAHDALNVPDGDGDGAGGEGLAAQVGVQAAHLVHVHVGEGGVAAGAGVEDVLAEEVLGDGLDDAAGRGLQIIGEGVQAAIRAAVGKGLGMRAHVGANDKASQALIGHGVSLVLDDAEDIEAGQDGLGQLDVLGEGQGGVVAAPNGVGRGDDGAAGLQGGDDAGLADADALLLHGLVDGGAIGVVHLVKLVDEADTAVGEDEGAALQCPFAGHRVLAHGRSQTHSRGTLACGVHGARGGLLDVLEELALGHTRVTQHEHIYVAAEGMLALDVLGLAAKETEGDGRLDFHAAVDGGSDGADDTQANERVFREAADAALVLFGQAELGELVLPLANMVGLDDGGEDGEAVGRVECIRKVVPVHTRNLLRKTCK